MDKELADDVRKGEILRFDDRKKMEHRRILYDRFRIAQSIAMVIVIIFSIVLIIISASNSRGQEKLVELGSATFFISRILQSLMKEATASIQYCAVPFNHLPDREMEEFICRYQEETLDYIFAASLQAEKCSVCGSIQGALDLEFLRQLQLNVLRRFYSPLECFLFYVRFMMEVSEVMSLFLGESINEVSALVLWEANLGKTLAVFPQLLTGLASGNLPQERLQFVYQKVSEGLFGLSYLKRYSFILDPSHPGWKEYYWSAVEPSYASGEIVLGEIDVTLNSQVETNELSPEEAIEAISSIYDDLLTKVANDEPWKERSTIYYTSEWLGIGSCVLGCLVLILGLYSALQILCFSTRFVLERENLERVSQSIERIEYFVNCLFELNQKGALYVQDMVRKEIVFTPIEREFFEMSSKFCMALCYIPTGIHSFREKILAQNKIQEAAASVSPLDNFMEGEGGSFGSPSPKGRFVPGRGDRNPFSSQPSPQKPWSTEFDMGNTNSTESSTLSFIPYEKEMAQVTTRATFVLADLSFLFNDFTLARSKAIAESTSQLIISLCRYIEDCKGHYVGVSGSTFIGMFSGGDVEEESVLFLLAIQRRLISLYPGLRCALVARKVSQMILKSPQVKAFITESQVLKIAGLLFRTARLYDSTFVVDAVTFVQINTQYFSKVALERVGFDSSATDDEVVNVYELAPTNTFPWIKTWNEAFDQFHNNNFEEAELLLRSWGASNGTNSKGYKRFLSIVKARQKVTYLVAPPNQLDLDFVSA